MTNKEIIELLKEQIQASNKREAELLARINELTQEIASLKEALLKKGESLGRQQRIAKGLAKLVSCQSAAYSQRTRQTRILPVGKAGYACRNHLR